MRDAGKGRVSPDDVPYPGPNGGGLAGPATAAFSEFHLLHVWAMLQRAYGQFEPPAREGTNSRTLIIADFAHDAFRLNCFATGISVLRGTLPAAVGTHGLCLLPGLRQERQEGSG